MNTVGKRASSASKSAAWCRCDAHRGLGREHRHPHPRGPAVPQPAAVRAGRRPWAAAPQLRRKRGRRLRARVRRGLRGAVRVHPRRQGGPEARARDLRRGPGLAGAGGLAIGFPSSTATGSRYPTRSSTPTSTRVAACTSTRSRWPSGPRISGSIGEPPKSTRTVRTRGRSGSRSLSRRPDRARQFFAATTERAPWLFPQLVDDHAEWLDECVTTGRGVTIGLLLLAEAGARRPRRSSSSIIRHGSRAASSSCRSSAASTPRASTDEVRFLTRKVVMDPPPEKSHLNHVVLDGLRGNTWEEAIACPSSATRASQPMSRTNVSGSRSPTCTTGAP